MGVTGLGQAPPAPVPKLFGDLLHNYGRVERFYPHPPSFEAAVAASRHVRMTRGHRKLLVDALASQNPTAAAQSSLSMLASDGTVAVVTGQQVGLLGGPAFTLYKALTAVRCAAELTRGGTPAVPVFWLATEDHDLEEVDHAWVWRPDGPPVRVRAATEGPQGAAVGQISIRDAGLSEFEACSEGGWHAAAANDLAKQHYSSPTDLGRSFRGLYGSLLEHTGLLFLCPLAAAIRELAQPILRDAILQTPQLAAALLRRGGSLRAAGYHEQVRYQGSSSLLMLFEGAERVALRSKNGAFASKSRSYSSAELLARLEDSPTDVSPSALLRPVVQDYLLPTTALIVGPSEASYLAQSAVLYRRLVERMPAVLPRASFTVVDRASRKLATKYGLSAADCFGARSALEAAISKRLVPEGVRSTLDRERESIERSLAAMESAVGSFDPTLAEGFRKSKSKIGYQLDKTNAKVGREALRRDATASRQAARLARWMRPGGNMQERVYCVLSLIARFGTEFTEAVYRAIEPGWGDHALLDV